MTTPDHTPANGAARTRQQVGHTLSMRFAGDVDAGIEMVDGAETVVVTAEADVPPLGLWGPSLHVDVAGHAVRETTDR